MYSYIYINVSFIYIYIYTKTHTFKIGSPNTICNCELNHLRTCIILPLKSSRGPFTSFTLQVASTP